MTRLLAHRELSGRTFNGRLEVRHDPANRALPFSLWWQPAVMHHVRHCRVLRLSARATAAEAIDLDLAWAEQALENGGLAS